jgi:hypothetical protein
MLAEITASGFSLQPIFWTQVVTCPRERRCKSFATVDKFVGWVQLCTATPGGTPSWGLCRLHRSIWIRPQADKDSSRIQPSRDYAANLLGLSEQGPAKVTSLTDGTDGKITAGNQEIRFKKPSPKSTATGRISGLVILGIAAPGKGQRRRCRHLSVLTLAAKAVFFTM